MDNCRYVKQITVFVNLGVAQVSLSIALRDRVLFGIAGDRGDDYEFLCFTTVFSMLFR